MAVALLQFCLPDSVLLNIDTESLTLSDDSFVDENLKPHFADVCYLGQTTGGEPLRITIIFEHKSNKPQQPVLEQLLRYISNVWSSDLKQGRAISLTLPVLVYHGKPAIQIETPATLFPNAPVDLLRFVPGFEYVLLDIQEIGDEQIDQIKFMLLQRFLLALKHSRNEDYIEQNWKKFV